MAAQIETTKCPKCGMENKLTAEQCEALSCRAYLKTDLECLRSIDTSLVTIKRIALWWLLLSILAVAAGLIYAFIETKRD
jgi:hypothetical protein